MFNIITDALIVLAAAIIVGELFEQIGLPSVAGELLSGMIVGPALLGFITVSDEILSVSYIALFFIIFHIGFEMKTQMVRTKIIGATILTLTSFLMPLILTTVAAAFLLPFGLQANLVIALAISVPSISLVSVLVLQFDLLKTDTGQIILSSVTVSDVLAFIILAALTRSIEATLLVLAQTALLILVFASVDWILNSRPQSCERFLGRAVCFFKRADFPFALLIICALGISVIFENIGLSYILGAFFAGLIIHDGLIGKKAFEKISNTLSTVNRIFFIPFFFGVAGLEVILANIELGVYAALALITALAFAAGVYVTYYVSHRSLQFKLNLHPRQVASILGGRGAIGIVIASVAVEGGILTEVGFSLVVVATLVMSLAIPFVTGKLTTNKPPP
ncbi:MAG: cation:proton antiporter [Candidatus Bathyarchaeota archaeon]|nr:cation:proton antiporter [Candidatus Bathyarchaeota archaeon]